MIHLWRVEPGPLFYATDDERGLQTLTDHLIKDEVKVSHIIHVGSYTFLERPSQSKPNDRERFAFTEAGGILSSALASVGLYNALARAYKRGDIDGTVDDLRRTAYRTVHVDRIGDGRAKEIKEILELL